MYATDRRGRDARAGARVTTTRKHREMDVSQNLISLDVTDEQVQGVLAALEQIEAALPDLLSMETGDRRGLMLMGPKSEVFARQTLRVLEQNPQIVPPSFDLAAAQADLAAFERLQPLMERVSRLSRRLEDSVAALGSDVMDAALDGYSHIKLFGGAHGLDELRRELGGRFKKRTAARREPEPA